MIQVIGLGAGGHAKGILEILQAQPGCHLVGLLDPNPALWGKAIFGVPILGGDDLLGKLIAEGIRHGFLGVGTVGNTWLRRKLYETASLRGLGFVQAIHSKAVVSSSAQIGAGVVIMAGAIVNSEAAVGQNVIVNTGSIIEHDCLIGDHVHVATGAALAGGVMVGGGTHVGIGASVKQGVRIGANVIVGAGAVVLEDVPDNVVVGGVPAKFLRTNPL